MQGSGCRGLVLVTVFCAGGAAPLAAQPAPADLSTILARAGQAIEAHFSQARQILSTEEVWVRQSGADRRLLDGPVRMLYDRRIEWDAGFGVDGEAPSARVLRQLIEVNGRPPTDRDIDRCVQAISEAEDPLVILLPSQQGDYLFGLESVDTVNGRAVAKLSYEPHVPEEAHIEVDGDCMMLAHPTVGDLWIEADSGHVVRLDERLPGQIDYRRPPDRLLMGTGRFTLERSDKTTRYETVTFQDPEETVMMPVQMSSLSVIRGGGLVPRIQFLHRFSNYRRFLGEGRLIAPP